MIECVDSIISPQTTGQPIPAAVMNAPALLAYNAGNSWPTFGPYTKARPDLAKKGWIVSTTLTCNAKARCYDIEQGGGTNGNIGVFMRNADRSHGLPILYTFASNGPAMLAAARSFGYVRGRDFYYLAAHPNSSHGRHVCHPNVCGYPAADGTQYSFAGSVDYSALNDYMLPHPKPVPQPRNLKGTLRFSGELKNGAWTIKGEPGDGVQLGQHDRWWEAKIAVHETGGQWRISGLPFGK